MAKEGRKEEGGSFGRMRKLTSDRQQQTERDRQAGVRARKPFTE
jgi:hypothetical protein